MLTTRQISVVPDSGFSIRNWVDGVHRSLSKDIPFEYEFQQATRKRKLRIMADASDDEMPSRQLELNTLYTLNGPGDPTKRRKQNTASDPGLGLSIRDRSLQIDTNVPVLTRGSSRSPTKTNNSRPPSPTKARVPTSTVTWLHQNGYHITFDLPKFGSQHRGPICEVVKQLWTQMKEQAAQPLQDIRVLTMLSEQYGDAVKVDRAIIGQKIVSLTKKSDQIKANFRLEYADWIQFCKILTKSKRSKKDATTTEAAWNNNVHTPIFDFAFPENVDGHNLHPLHATQMVITDSSDLPASKITDEVVDIQDTKSVVTATSTRSTGAKMIDYVLCIDGDEDFDDTVHEYLPACRISNKGTMYVNHTAGNDIVNQCPISVNIETKKDNTLASQTEAKNQITIWLLAQYNNLASRFKLEKYPTMPVILVFGDLWEFYVAERQNDATLRFWQLPKAAYSSSSPEELMKIIQLLRYLKDWSHQVHKKWWMERIAEVTAGDTPSPAKGPITSAAEQAGNPTPPGSGGGQV